MNWWQKVLSFLVTISGGVLVLNSAFHFDNTIDSWASVSQLIFYVCSTILVLMAIVAFRKELRAKKKKEKMEKRTVRLKLGKSKPEKVIDAIFNMEDNILVAHNWIEKIGKKANEIMTKIKGFLNQYKGYLATALTGLFALLNTISGLSSNVFNELFVIGGTDYLATLLWVLPIVIGALSNGFTTEFWNEMMTKWKEQKNEGVEEAAIIKEEVTALNTKIAIKEKEIAVAVKKAETLNSDLTTLQSKSNIKKGLVAKGVLTQEMLQKTEDEVKEKEVDVQVATAEVDALQIELKTLEDTKALLNSEV